MANPAQSISLVLISALILDGCIAVNLPTDIIRVPDGGVANISLNKYNLSSKEDQAFTRLALVDGNAKFLIKVYNIPPEVTFIIAQVHAYLYNVTIAYDKVSPRIPGKFVTGTNIGLLVETKTLPTADLYVSNDNNFEINSLIAVVAYTHN
ncbi:hypothetical protein QAD02_012382, partial [Eretmocerus hayati]